MSRVFLSPALNKRKNPSQKHNFQEGFLCYKVMIPSSSSFCAALRMPILPE